MEHSQRFNSFSVRSALARLSLGATLLFACLTAQAGTLTLSNFVLTWTPGTTPEAGGGAIVHYDDGSLTWNQSFQVNVASFITALNDRTQGVNDWITPVAGSGITFAPVDLYNVFGDGPYVPFVLFGENYSTSIGWADFADPLAYLNGGKPSPFDKTELGFFNKNTWEITVIDRPASSVPEPSSIALLSIALIGGLSARRKNRKNAGPDTNPHG